MPDEAPYKRPRPFALRQRSDEIRARLHNELPFRYAGQSEPRGRARRSVETDEGDSFVERRVTIAFTRALVYRATRDEGWMDVWMDGTSVRSLRGPNSDWATRESAVEARNTERRRHRRCRRRR